MWNMALQYPRDCEGETAMADDPSLRNTESDLPAAALPDALLQGWLLTLVAKEPQHGYAITKRVTGLPFVTPHQTTIYRHLSSLEEQGLLDSRWTMRSSAPPIRTYHLTDAGRQYLRETYGAISRLQRVCRTFLDEASDHL